MSAPVADSPDARIAAATEAVWTTFGMQDSEALTVADATEIAVAALAAADAALVSESQSSLRDLIRDIADACMPIAGTDKYEVPMSVVVKACEVADV